MIRNVCKTSCRKTMTNHIPMQYTQHMSQPYLMGGSCGQALSGSYLTRSTVKEPSFMPKASCDPSLLKATLRMASSMLQRAMRAWSTRLHSLQGATQS